MIREDNTELKTTGLPITIYDDTWVVPIKVDVYLISYNAL